jgi:hypothetical protein
VATFDDVQRLCADLPDVTVTTWYGTPALAVRGRAFCRMWSHREHDRDGIHDTDVLVVLCDPDEKRHLIAAAPLVLFSTPHYEGRGAMLIRLADIDLPDLTGYLEESYRKKAPAPLLRRLDGR